MQSPLQLLDLRGPAARLGLTGTVKEFVIDTGHFFSVDAGPDSIPGNADDRRYRKATPASFVFQAEFFGFMPFNRANAGPDGVLTTYDDSFTIDQLAALDLFLGGKALEIRQAVEADFSPINEGKGAYTFVDAGGDLTLTWIDCFDNVGGTDESGLSGAGAPIFGRAQFDVDHSTDHNGDGVILKPILTDDKLPGAAKIWALAEELNTTPRNSGKFGVAINISFKSHATFAQFVANTVSHELGHTFGLIDSYVNAITVPGDAQVDKKGNAIPFDIMRTGDDFDADLSFLPSNVQLLRAAMGIAPEGNIGGGVSQYRRTFNLPRSPFGVRENTPGTDDDAPPADAVLVAVTEDGFWYGGLDGPPLELGETPADGDDGESQFMGVGIHNAGGKPLDVSAIALVNGLAGFVLEDTTDALGNDIDPGDTVEFFVRFDPSRVGDAADVIEIVSNAPDQSIVRVPLTGTGAQFAPMAMVNVTDGGNFGGVSLGTNRTVTSLAAITNAGRQPLIVGGIRIVEGDGSFRLLNIPPDLATNPISLGQDASFAFGGRFDPSRLGLARAMVEITTNDAQNPILTFSLTGTGTRHWPRPVGATIM